jgi:DNA-binding response OmpR family regulator
MIIDSIWKLESPPEEDTVKVHVRSLRQKLKSAGLSADLIETVHGIGYRLANFTETSRDLCKGKN